MDLVIDVVPKLVFDYVAFSRYVFDVSQMVRSSASPPVIFLL